MISASARRTMPVANLPGEIGGLLSHDEKPAYYGAPLAPLTLDTPFSASGTIALKAAGSDSGVYLGWFHSSDKQANLTSESEAPQPNLLGLMIEGPSRVGLYVRPTYRNADRQGSFPRRVRSFSRTAIRTPGPFNMILKPPTDQARSPSSSTIVSRPCRSILNVKLNARFDRFGLVNFQTGGHHLVLFLDDLRLMPSP